MAITQERKQELISRFGDGPVCKLALPERISSGTHATWAAGAQLRHWHTADSPAAAIGL